MISLLISFAVLLIGYIVYGRVTQKVWFFNVLCGINTKQLLFVAHCLSDPYDAFIHRMNALHAHAIDFAALRLRSG